MKKILVISPFFYPELISTGKFNTDMVIALRDKGHNVKVLCYHPFYPEWRVTESDKKLKGITIIRGGKNIVFSSKTILRRIVLEFSFMFFVLRKIVKHQKNIDIIIPVFPPSLAFYFITFLLKKETKKVGIVHDLQEIYSSKKKGNIFKFFNKVISHVEKKVYSSCDRLIFLSEEMKIFARDRYQLREEDLKVQYPFVTIDAYKDKKDELSDLFDKDKKHIVYSGALGEKQNPIALYNLFEYCSTKLIKVHFHFFSKGNVFNELKSRNKNLNIYFHNLVSKDNIEEMYQKSFIQIIPQQSGTSQGSLPSKLPNLLASRCNIICITDKDSEIDKLFLKHQLNKVLNSWNKDLFLEAINDFFEKKESNNQLHLEISDRLFNVNSMINIILEE